MELYFVRDRDERDGAAYCHPCTITITYTLEQGQLRSSRFSTDAISPPQSQRVRSSSLRGVIRADGVYRFWQHTINVAETIDDDFKHQALPLARIKKVMKIDPDVKVRLPALSSSLRIDMSL